MPGRSDPDRPAHHRRVRLDAAGQLRARAVRRPRRHDRRAREVLLRPARGARRRATSRHTLDLGHVDGRLGAGVPRLGRLEPPGRDRLAAAGSRPRRSTSPARRRHVPGTHDARLPCPARSRPASWAAELGVAAVVAAGEGDPDGRSPGASRSTFSQRPGVRRASRYRTAPLLDDAGASRGRAGTRATCTSTPSTPRSATRRCARSSTTRSPASGAGSTSSRSPTTSTDAAWGEIGRYQTRLPRQADRPLAPRSSPTAATRTTTRARTYVDYRTGPVYERRADGALTLRCARRGRRARSSTRSTRAGGWTQINHPTIFPSAVPALRASAAAARGTTPPPRRDYAQVDAIEVATGPPARRATLRRTRSRRPRSTSTSTRSPRARTIAAVGSSDSHHAGRRSTARRSRRSGTARPSSTPTSSPSAASSGAVEAGHTYVKICGAERPGPALHRPAARRAPDGDLRRHRPRAAARSSRRARPPTACSQLVRDGTVIATGARTPAPHRDRVGPLRPAAPARASSPRPSARRSGSARPRRPASAPAAARAACAASRRRRA